MVRARLAEDRVVAFHSVPEVDLAAEVLRAAGARCRPEEGCRSPVDRLPEELAASPDGSPATSM